MTDEPKCDDRYLVELFDPNGESTEALYNIMPDTLSEGQVMVEMFRKQIQSARRELGSAFANTLLPPTKVRLSLVTILKEETL